MISQTQQRTTSVSSLNSISPIKPRNVSGQSIMSPSPVSKGKEREEIPNNGLLVPTDRPREELEEKWLRRLGMGGMRIHSEVELRGYSLYSLRSWYLSRTHWAQTIVTPTGPRDHITAYLLTPDPELGERQGKAELEAAVRYLMNETGSQQRKTEYGILLTNKAQNFGQDVSPIPGGDLREAKPYMILNTGLRRLGCGARAALGIECPVPALRRKFYELYRLPQPSSSNTNTSPTTSPHRRFHRSSSPTQTSTTAGPVQADLRLDPFTIMVIEVVKLVQAALALWGLFGRDREEFDINGLFCEETKSGIFKWRGMMGMEKETLKLEKETSGGCIDPKTLAALLSSVTSVTYEMHVLGVSAVPRDPFRSVKRFLTVWRRAHEEEIELHSDHPSQYLDVDSIRNLNKAYLARRSKHPSEWFPVHHLVLSSVAHATSSLTANLKGTEDGPLRRREHRPDFSLSDSTSSESGLKLITPDSEVGTTAAPDIITTSLEAYTNGIKKSKERDLLEMGAKRIGDLWKGNVGDEGHKRGFGLLSRKNTIRSEGSEEDSEDVGRGMGALARTGQAFKGLVGRKGSVVETSDSEAGIYSGKRKQSTVPTVIEPDLEEIDEQLDDRFSASPSPSGGQRLDIPFPASSSRSQRSNQSNARAFQRPSINTNLSNASYERSHHHPSNATSMTSNSTAHPHPESDPSTSTARANGNGIMKRTPSERPLLWRERGQSAVMLRSSSDGADISIDERGNEWEVICPHGTGKGQRSRTWRGKQEWDEIKREVKGRTRRHSQEDIMVYQFTRIEKAEHLAVDIEMCSLVLELRQRERQLAEKNQEMKTLAASITSASKSMALATYQRQAQLQNHLKPQIEALERRLEASINEISDPTDLESIKRYATTLSYRLSDDPHFEAMVDRMEMLGRQYKLVQDRKRSGVVDT